MEKPLCLFIVYHRKYVHILTKTVTFSQKGSIFEDPTLCLRNSHFPTRKYTRLKHTSFNRHIIASLIDI